MDSKRKRSEAYNGEQFQKPRKFLKPSVSNSNVVDLTGDDDDHEQLPKRAERASKRPIPKISRSSPGFNRAQASLEISSVRSRPFSNPESAVSCETPPTDSSFYNKQYQGNFKSAVPASYRKKQDVIGLGDEKPSQHRSSFKSLVADYALPSSPLNPSQPFKPASKLPKILRTNSDSDWMSSPPTTGRHASSGVESIMTTLETSKKQKKSRTKKPKTEPDLCQEQQDLVNLILSGRNVFYTGSAGCGKSTVLKNFVKQLRDRGKKVVIVAPTGRAALEVNGATYFTFAGWVPDSFKKPLKKLEDASHGRFVRKRLNDVNVLVIDEISMLENYTFERLNAIMQTARGSSKAFGGVQLVVTGDFCQLPPVKPFRTCITCGREMIE
jgi:hypothetical protein